MKEALLLFAKKGYAHTSTKAIALHAGVSEALIFRHFVNKDSLLFHLIKSGYRRILLDNKGMMTYNDPKSFLRNMINLPKKLVSEETLFWKMQASLSHHEFSKQQHELFMKPVHPMIRRAFAELKYENPDLETQFLLFFIEILWKKIANGELSDATDLTRLMEKKYGL